LTRAAAGQQDAWKQASDAEQDYFRKTFGTGGATGPLWTDVAGRPVESVTFGPAQPGGPRGGGGGGAPAGGPGGALGFEADTIVIRSGGRGGGLSLSATGVKGGAGLSQQVTSQQQRTDQRRGSLGG
jgi:hypothetical protein